MNNFENFSITIEEFFYLHGFIRMLLVEVDKKLVGIRGHMYDIFRNKTRNQTFY